LFFRVVKPVNENDLVLLPDFGQNFTK